MLGDTVELIDRSPPRLLITGRTSYFLSAFGEHLTAQEIEEAIAGSAAAIGAAVNDFSVAPIYPEREGARGGHLFLVEFAGEPPASSAIESFAEHLDKAFLDTNEDYVTHRAGGYGMHAPQIRVVAKGGFAAWMKARGRLGGQHKVPRVITDPELFRQLLDFMDHHQIPGGR